MRAVEEYKIKQAAAMPSVPPRTVLGDISKVVENQAIPGQPESQEGHPEGENSTAWVPTEAKDL